MNLYDFFSNLSIGGGFTIFIVLTLLVEIVPIKIYPLKWLGTHINAELTKKIDSIDNRMDQVEKNLNEHVAESYRTTLLDFQDKILQGCIFTKDQWAVIIKICGKYEKHIKDNGLINGDATEAIAFIRWQFQENLKTKNFADLPKEEKQ